MFGHFRHHSFPTLVASSRFNNGWEPTPRHTNVCHGMCLELWYYFLLNWLRGVTSFNYTQPITPLSLTPVAFIDFNSVTSARENNMNMIFCLHNFNWPLINIVISRAGVKSGWQIKTTLCLWNAAQFQHKPKREPADRVGEILWLCKQNEIDPSSVHAIANMTIQHLFLQGLQVRPAEKTVFYQGTNISSSVAWTIRKGFALHNLKLLLCWNWALAWWWPCLCHHKIHSNLKPYPGEKKVNVCLEKSHPVPFCNYLISKQQQYVYWGGKEQLQ